jgi:signal transduction histidine kinase
MATAPRSRVGDVLAAVAIAAAALAVRQAIDPWLGSVQPFPPGFAAVAAAVWYWGPRAGIITAVLCYLWGSILFSEPRGAIKLWGVPNVAALATNLISSFLIVAIGSKARAARAAEARFRAAQELSLHPFTILRAVRDGAGAIQDFEWTFANEAAARALKAAPAELIGSRLLERLPGNRHQLFPLYCRVVESGQGHDVEVEYQHDGIDGWFRNMAVPIGDGVAVSFAEITESKRLEHLLTERDAMKDRFLAVLAHELRQPLNAIRMAVRAGRANGTPSAQVSELLDRQVSHLSRLVEDLNDLTRISEGRFELRVERTDLRRPIQAAVETCLPLLQATGRVMTVRLADEPLWMDGDEARLRQVFSNLLSNAERATRDGGGIEVTALPTDEGRQLEIRVRDSGQGIPPDKLPGIFALFAQDRPDSAHVGVGLALVKHLVELHGGRVRVSSDGPGCGATFTVHLPAAVPNSPARPSSAATGGVVPTGG